MDNKRLQNCLLEAKNKSALSKDEMKSWKVHICSVNNFPTAAGLASSAAGYACLSVALAKLFKYEGNVSALARIGSGSACRSTYGGFVRWYMGEKPTGADSVAKQIVPSSYWPEMRILILVTSEDKKAVSSAIAMKRGVETSEFLKYRAKSIVPKRVEEMERAIMEKNFVRFAELTMKDSNSFHAVAVDTFPPCHYLNDASRAIIDLVHAYNSAIGSTRIAYTNDAGPNTVLYLLEEDVPRVISVIQHFLPPAIEQAPYHQEKYFRGEKIIPAELSQNYLLNIPFSVQSAGLLKYIIYTRIGDGPKYLDDPNQHLLDNRGFPIIP
ncbi:diphosphomevalonate decarboxylase isoform X2 [Venturia canescens]|nr:diphosphomevalonate decarboxylase isoform X2 [Venturia canescens]